VSFDFNQQLHRHDRASQAFAGIGKLLKPGGRCLVIESHPFFGQVLGEIPSGSGEYFCIRSPHYLIECRRKTDVHHWLTLDEMTRASSEGGLAILQSIHEPDPDPASRNGDPIGYEFRVKYPRSYCL